MKILYYAHHHGSGHLQHGRRLQGLGVGEVLVVGGAGADLTLPPDVDLDRPHRQPAGSPFHWTPTDPGVRRRFADFHEALLSVDPDVVMVDVSVEAAVFAHLAGYRVAHRRMPGHREDLPHELAYSSAARLFAYYPESLEQSDFAWGGRTSWLGMVEQGPPLPSSAVKPGTVVVLTGAGGDRVDPEALCHAALAAPLRKWDVLGPNPNPDVQLPDTVRHHGWVADPAPFLARAEVVVCGAGHNTLAPVVSAHKRFVLAPERRPHAEQEVFAAQLHRVLGVPVVDDWRAVDWEDVLASPADGREVAADLLVDPATFTRRVSQFLRDALAA